MNPLNAVFYQGLGSVGADNLNTFLQVVETIAQLRTFTGLSNMAVLTLGTSAPGDGGANLYYYNATSTASDNGTTVIVPSGNTVGAWLALPLA